MSIDIFSLSFSRRLASAFALACTVMGGSGCSEKPDPKMIYLDPTTMTTHFYGQFYGADNEAPVVLVIEGQTIHSKEYVTCYVTAHNFNSLHIQRETADRDVRAFNQGNSPGFPIHERACKYSR